MAKKKKEESAELVKTTLVFWSKKPVTKAEFREILDDTPTSVVRVVQLESESVGDPLDDKDWYSDLVLLDDLGNDADESDDDDLDEEDDLDDDEDDLDGEDDG